MPKVDDKAKLDEAARLNQSANAVQHGLQDNLKQLQQQAQQLMGQLGLVDQAANSDAARTERMRPAAVNDALKREMEALHKGLEELDLKSIPPDVARDLDQALANEGDLDALDQQVTQQAADAQQAAQQRIDPTLDDQAYASQMLDRQAAQQDLQAYQSAKQAVDTARDMRSMQQQLQELQDGLASSMTPGQAMAAVEKLVDQAQQVRDEEDRKKRISWEMTNGEIDF